MAHTTLHTFIRQMHRLIGRRAAGGLADVELLQRFIAQNDEAAFEVLVWRHGPMVWNVCQRVLRNSHDVEDAFQATFLVFVRKAGSIRLHTSLSSWLYQVAYRVALKAKARTAQRTRHETDRVAFSLDGRIMAMSAPSQEILLWDLRHGKELRRLKGFDADVTSLAFSPDGGRLVSGLSDSTLLVWDITAVRKVDKRSTIVAVDPAQAWSDLGGDARKAFAARCTLAELSDKAVALLKEHLKPAPPVDVQRLRRLLTDLESDRFPVREEARKGLEAMGELARNALRRTLAAKPSLEKRQRIELLMEKLHGPLTHPETLQALRGVAVLEDIATPEAKQILATLAKGAPEARLTQEAKASLERLAKRSAGAP
jgi:RNA polymerase sigma factor (sigma-70 family)